MICTHHGGTSVQTYQKVVTSAFDLHTDRILVIEYQRTDPFKLWGATGAITKFGACGTSIGTPTLNEYPVDPVGVETISPSA